MLSIRIILILFTLLSGTLFLVDKINDGSILSNHGKVFFNISNRNFAGTLLLPILINQNSRIQNVNSPEYFDNIHTSETFKYFKNDSIGNQLIIIVESFGLFNDESLQSKFEVDIGNQFKLGGWRCDWGITPFTFGTTCAELRELLNCKGDYRYFLKTNNQLEKNLSIFSLKKRQGYLTMGVHSCKGQIFERDHWWKKIGIESAIFEDEISAKSGYKLLINIDTPFSSLNDEDAFDYIQTNVNKQKKNFAYLLTVNTHLPFKGNYKEAFPSKKFSLTEENVSNECKNQIIRLKNLLDYFANNLDKTLWDKVLIVGDHMPPYTKINDRSFFNQNKVPFCLISPSPENKSTLH